MSSLPITDRSFCIIEFAEQIDKQIQDHSVIIRSHTRPRIEAL